MQRILSFFAMALVVAMFGCESKTFRADELQSGSTVGQAIQGETPICKEQTWYLDSDGDGHGDSSIQIKACKAPAKYVAISDDCNDNAASVYLGAPEICDNVDNDCNGQTDDNVSKTWFLDLDGDGHGNPAYPQTGTCKGSQPWLVSVGDDCNDSDQDLNGDSVKDGFPFHPGAKELCNGVDDNCNGQVDEGTKVKFYKDEDGDGHGDANKTVMACQPGGQIVVSSDDCNDADKLIYPGAPESCNKVDDDCNSKTDDALVYVNYFTDADKDGFGAGNAISACKQPTDTSLNNTDCDDNNAAVHAPQPYFVDNDKDGFGSVVPANLCAAVTPTGYSGNNTDCDDNNAAVHAPQPYFVDNDKDGFGSVVPANLCAAVTPTGYSGNNTDCNDADATVHPGAKEVCDGKDNACTGTTKLLEPDSLCDDGDKFSKDLCGGASGCTHEQHKITLSCFNPPDYTVAKGYSCSVTYFIGDPSGPSAYTMTIGKDSVTLLMKDVCAQLALGKVLHANSALFWNMDMMSAIWAGGAFTKLIDNFTNLEIQGSLGNVTLSTLAPDADFVSSDFDICK